MPRTFAKIVVLAAALSGLGSQARADFITGLFNTGVNATGTGLAAAGSSDAHYTITSSPLGAVAADVATSVPSTYASSTATSQWIGPDPAFGNEPGGIYSYSTSFMASGTAVSISGLLAGDDSVTILLNGVNEGSFVGFNSLRAFAITSGFTAGVNTLTFLVNNSNPITPTGLQVSGLSFPTAVPEPSSFAMCGLAGLVGLVVAKARRKRLA